VFREPRYLGRAQIYFVRFRKLELNKMKTTMDITEQDVWDSCSDPVFNSR